MGDLNENHGDCTSTTDEESQAYNRDIEDEIIDDNRHYQTLPGNHPNSVNMGDINSRYVCEINRMI